MEIILKKYKKLIIGVVLSIFLLLVLRISTFTVPTGTVWVLKTFSEISAEELEPGLHFKLPIAQTYELFDVKQNTVHYSEKSAGKISSNGLFYRPAITVLDDKKLKLTFDISVQFKPDPTKVDKILALYGENYFEKKLNSIFREIIRDVGGKYSSDDISQKRTEISEDITLRITKAFETLPFFLEDVNVRDINLPDVIVKKAITIQEANQEEERLTLVEKQNIQEKKNETIKAETNEIKIQKAADAKAYAIIKEAEAIAEANRRINESLTSNIIKFKTVETWDGKLPITSLQGENGVNPNIILGNK